MPNYDFKCPACGTILEHQFLRITHLPDEVPHCCESPMNYHITQPPLVHWKDPMIEPFRAIATKDRPVITTAKQNREYMARNGLVDANEVVEKPPTHEEQAETHAQVVESIEKISPSAEVRDNMDKQGLLDPLT